jgi:hypothetical protein
MLSDVCRGYWRSAVAGTALLALGGCASFQDMAGVPRAGYQANGTYVVSAEEEKLACRQIKDRLDILSAQLKVLPARAAVEQSSSPATVGSALGRMFGGPGDGLTATADFQRATAETEALNQLLVKKQCV